MNRRILTTVENALKEADSTSTMTNNKMPRNRPVVDLGEENMNGEQWLAKRRLSTERLPRGLTRDAVSNDENHEIDSGYANRIGTEYFSLATNDTQVSPDLTRNRKPTPN
jgi:hypothetical protein